MLFAGPEGHILTMPNGEKIQFKESDNSPTEDSQSSIDERNQYDGSRTSQIQAIDLLH